MTAMIDDLPDPLDPVVEDFLRRRRGGEQPSAEEYAGRHPELAERIRVLFPTLLLLEGSPALALGQEPVPAALGPFRIVSGLGRGGMGVVYEAVQEPLGRRVALKVLAPEYARRPSYRERFAREAQAAARLHHTNIVPVFASGDHEGTLYFAMQYIDGRSAATLLAGLRAKGTVPADHPRRMAGLALQATEALAYAHAQGVLHRDVKPSNLLVDERGMLWVADFGLAKPTDAVDLTTSGQVLGTLRYLAPERLAGKGGPAADVYALGATLYELLALRPAFPGDDSLALLRDIGRGAVTQLRQLSPAVPPDLETIVHTALAADPTARYPSAQALADDLRRFLSDLPVQARRTSVTERLARWARRNPLVAGLSAAVALLLVVSCVGALAAAWRLNRVAGRAGRAEHEAKERLFEALLARVEVSRASGRPGQRFATREAVAQAAAVARELGRSAEERVRLCNAAAACLALPDLAPEQEWEGNPPGTTGFGFDAGFERYAWSFRDEGISVRRLADHSELLRLPTPPSDRVSRWARCRFSSGGRYLAANYRQSGDRDPLEVWDLQRDPRRPVHTFPDVAGLPEFSADDRLLVTHLRDGEVVVVELPSGRERRRFRPGAAAEGTLVHPGRRGPGQGLALRPDGRRLAVASTEPPRVQLCDLEAGSMTRELAVPGDVPGLAWSPDGRLLAAACTDGRVHLWDGSTGRPEASLAGHRWGVQDVAFDETGRWLASFGWDMTLRLWDVGARRPVLDLEDVRVVDFRHRGGIAAAGLTGRNVRVWGFRPSSVYRAIYAPGLTVEHLAFSPDGRWLASDGPGSELCVWGVRAGREAARPPDWRRLLWGPAGDWFVGARADGLVRGPVAMAAGVGPDTLRLGPVNRLGGPPEDARPYKLTWIGPAGRRVAAVDCPGSRVRVVDLGPGGDRVRWEAPHANVGFTASGPDGRLLATGSFEGGRGVRLWESETGRLVRELPIGDATVAFSPDGEWLYTATGRLSPGGAALRAWRVDSGEPGPVLALDRSASSPACLDVAPDGTIAVVHTMNDVRLVEPQGFQEILTLIAPEPALITQVQFGPGGDVLAAASGGQIALWDLKRLRTELRELGLD